MLAHFLAFGGEHYAILGFHCQPQLQRVDGIQAQAVAKQRRFCVNIIGGQFVEIQGGDNQIFNFSLERLHRCFLGQASGLVLIGTKGVD